MTGICKEQTDRTTKLLERLKNGKLLDEMYLLNTNNLLTSIDDLTQIAIDCTDEIRKNNATTDNCNRIIGLLCQISSISQTVKERLEIEDFDDVTELIKSL